MKEQLTDAQKRAIQAIGLSVEGITKVEDATGWRFAQHTTNGTDIRFIVRKIKGEYELVIWLKKKITVGVYVTRDKRHWQEVFSKKLGAWSPVGMDTEGYEKKGNSEIRGHIGDWKTNFNANEFMKNLESIKVMVQSITGKLDETGISEQLANGKPYVNLGDIEDDDDYDNEEEATEEERKCIMPRNLIMFGAPGTGKSHRLEEACKVFGERYERVTFYPTYSYAQFVGTYKPVMKEVEAAMKSDGLSDDELSNILKEDYNNSGGGSDKTKTAAVLLFAEKYYESLSKTSIPQIIKKAGLPESSYTAWLSTGMALARARAHNVAGKKEATIAYEFVPGPFLRVLVRALNDSQNDYCLVIEEINRANAAAVFGDVFQLLDRALKDDAEKNVKKDTSEYAIAASEDVKKYLGEALTEAGKNALLELTGSIDRLKIPANMYIWATMNSADQGVFPMDTAFKRRWAFKYLGLDNGVGADDEDKWLIGMKDNKFTYTWEEFRRYVNRLLALAKVNEDKLMGPFFMKKPASGTIDKDEFESKVLMYLWEDAGKMCRRQLFGDISTYSELIDAWEENGIEIFSSNLRERDTIDRGKGDPKKSRNAKELYKAFEKSLMRDLNNRSPDKE